MKYGRKEIWVILPKRCRLIFLSNPGIVEHVHIGVTCSPDEIKTILVYFKNFVMCLHGHMKKCLALILALWCMKYQLILMRSPFANGFAQCTLEKAAAIKGEVEKLLKAGFIYPIPLTDWVSNIVPVTKKQGTIRVCVDYRDLNRACPKDNYPTPFIDQIIDECAGSEIFSFMDGFSGYNQINIAPADQEKTTFICPWGTFAYKKLPFGLKNVGATFQGQCPMRFMIFATLFSLTWMTFLLILVSAKITLTIFDRFFSL
jgi:hypothetical protein